MHGKFLHASGEKLYVKGVTYGTFATDDAGIEQLEPEQVRADFEAMGAAGINAVRTYTVPPRWLLDIADESDLHVLIGVPWEQHVTFLDDRRLARDIERRVAAGIRACAGHPAVLGYSVGNEIPASIVRWHGRRAVERFVHRLYNAAKDEDPEGLVTYVNFPSTEYLELPFLDFVAFNVYLEQRERLAAYLARLHNLAGDRPLVMAEIGLDSRRNGLEGQAESLDWQVRTAFAEGCAGAFAFAWTDEWHRGGFEIEDWDFGLVDRRRNPKPALAAVRSAFEDVPFAANGTLPRVSVVVCTYNGAATIRETCEGLAGLDYPDYEVIVVDDGSSDATAAIAADYDVKVITTGNRGLSAARNTGLAASTGEIVAYIDDDARPDPQWLRYLVHTFRSDGYAAVGGPNVPPPDDPPVAACVAKAPGGPIHVLVSDSEAEHVPGCNMAFRRDALCEIEGFDEGFWVAGDDVDACWRIQERGWKIGFSHAAMVWHRRRNSVRAYLRQQRGYGRAEALLARKWPQKYNAAGHATWAGRIYADGLPTSLVQRRKRVRYGRWGAGLFQRLYTPESPAITALPLMPEWLLLLAGLAVLTALGSVWTPLELALPVLALAVALTLLDAGLSARRSWLGSVNGDPTRGRVPWRLRLLTAWLFLAQPAARLWGRIQYGLHPWRLQPRRELAAPLPASLSYWSEAWRAVDEWVQAIEERLRREAAGYIVGDAFDRWDLEVRGGLFGRARLQAAIEEHGAGRQNVRLRLVPTGSWLAYVLVVALGVLGLAAVLSHEWTAACVLGAGFSFVAVRTALEMAAAMGALHRASRLDESTDTALVAELAARAHDASRHEYEIAEPE